MTSHALLLKASHPLQPPPIIIMKHRILPLLLMIAATAVLKAQNPIFADSSTHTFAIRGNDTLRLDYYRPINPRDDHAMVVYLYGGAFINGSRNSASTRGDFAGYLQQGFSVAAVDYRKFLGTVDFDKYSKIQMLDLLDTAIAQAVEDLSEAIAYLVSHAEPLGIDTSKMILTGVSAGGITVLSLDQARVNGYARAQTLPQGFRPAAIVSYSGAIFSRRGAIRYDHAPAPTAFFYGDNDKVVPYSCIRIFNIYYGGSECLLPLFEARNFYYWSFCFSHHGHEVCAYTPYTLQEFNAFIDAVFDGRKLHYATTCTDDRFKLSAISKFTLTELIDADGT